MERRDFLGIKGLGEEDADRLLQLIDELTVVEGEAPAAEEAAPAESDSEDDEAEGADDDDGDSEE